MFSYDAEGRVVCPFVSGQVVPWPAFEAFVDAGFTHAKYYSTCDAMPWAEELMRRIEEARAAGSNIINLSFTHPRGFFPPQMRSRPQIRDILKQCEGKGWLVATHKKPPSQEPARFFNPRHPSHPTAHPAEDPASCDTLPYKEEIAKREREAEAEGYWVDHPFYGRRKVLGITDLTNFHPRGGIPPGIIQRMARRKDPKWREMMTAEIDRLRGLANKDESFAKTQKERAEAVDDPRKVLAAAEEMLQRAASFRAQADALKRELG